MTNKKLESKNKKKKSYDKPISLYSLKVDEALSLFMKVDPKKLKEEKEDALPSA